MRTRSAIVLACAIPSTLILADSVMSKRNGIFPNDVIATFNVGSLTRTSSRSCGQCHLGGHGSATVAVNPATRSLLPGGTTAVSVAVTSTIGSTNGGFTADVTAGTLVAGSGSKVNGAANAITHSGNASRSWAFSYKAANTPGLVELYTVGLGADGNSRNTGDGWAFHGSVANAATSTPVRMFVNAPKGVKPVGESCADGQGNHSVLGAPVTPAVGASTFKIEGHGMAPAAPLLFMLSIGSATPGFDMAPMGAPGCILHTSLQLQAVAGTTAGNQERSEGQFILPMPIPNQTALRGVTFAVQLAFIDSKSKRTFPLTTTNALECTIQ